MVGNKIEKFTKYCDGIPIPQEISLDLTSIENISFLEALQIDFEICNKCQVARKAFLTAPMAICEYLNLMIFAFLYAKKNIKAPYPSHHEFSTFLHRAKSDPSFRGELLKIIKEDKSPLL